MNKQIAIASLLIGAAALAHAQKADGPLPELLKGIPQATGVCKRDAAVTPQQSKAAPQVVEGREFSACVIGVPDLVALVASGKLTIADIRSAQAYERGSIEGALNITRSDLETKSYLRARPVVLVGDGKSQRDLVEACTQLRANGFARPLVLNGGLPAWVAQGQPVVGRARADHQVPRLGSVELWAESRFDANLVVIDETLKPVLAKLAQGKAVAAIDEASLRRLVDERKKAKLPIASLVLAKASPWTDEQLSLLRDAVKPVPVLAYSGLADVFAKDMQSQMAMWNAHARGPKQPSCGG